ncbi:MAG: PD-(D/E)XK nuclease family protein [bacterium]
MNTKEMMKTTQSLWSNFRNCRRKCKIRTLDKLVPNQKEKCLSFGSVIHEALETWHGGYDFKPVLTCIDNAYPQKIANADQKRDWHLATAMMKGYIGRYPSEEFQVIALEKVFEGPIVNPLTGKTSRSFYLAGKVDGIIRYPDGSYWLLEHKTASQITPDYIERLWVDFQIALYSWYVREYLGIPVVGILYNILGKTTMRQGNGETEEEYQERRQKLIAKSKTGKTSAKRKIPESDEDFQDRLAEKYAQEDMLRREELYISNDRYEDLQVELWKLTQAFLEARRNDNFYRNPDYCFHYNRACSYYPICSSNDNPLVIENHYQVVEPHEELRSCEENVF